MNKIRAVLTYVYQHSTNVRNYIDMIITQPGIFEHLSLYYRYLLNDTLPTKRCISRGKERQKKLITPPSMKDMGNYGDKNRQFIQLFLNVLTMVENCSFFDDRYLGQSGL